MDFFYRKQIVPGTLFRCDIDADLLYANMNASTLWMIVAVRDFWPNQNKQKIRKISTKISSEVEFVAIMCDEKINHCVGSTSTNIMQVLGVNTQIQDFRLRIFSGEDNRNNPRYKVEFNLHRKLVYSHKFEVRCSCI